MCLCLYVKVTDLSKLNKVYLLNWMELLLNDSLALQLFDGLP